MAYTETRIAELEKEGVEWKVRAEAAEAELAKANFNAEAARHNHEGEVRELRSELAKAREALEPFAATASILEGSGGYFEPNAVCFVEFRHLSRARAALQLEEKKG